MKKTIMPLLTSIIVGLSSCISANETAANWSYQGDNTGPDKWASLSAENSLCASGKNQSPINIDTKKTYNAQTKGIKFNYGLILANSIKNTGNLIQVEVGGGTNINVDDTEYVLKHLDFHIPSENKIDDQHYPMEIQFVHESRNKELAYVSVMVVPGRQSRFLGKLLEQMPAVGESKRLKGKTLRSIEMEKKIGSYYRYNGSITKPPCSEGVRWFVMKPQQTFSKEQYEQFKAAIGEDNNRPVQNLNARVVVD